MRQFSDFPPPHSPPQYPDPDVPVPMEEPPGPINVPADPPPPPMRARLLNGSGA